MPHCFGLDRTPNVPQEQTLDSRDSWAIICGSYINAYSLVRSIRNTGWKGRVVCLKDQEEASALVDLLCDSTEVWELALEDPGGIIDLLCERIPEDDPKIVFFTSECFHQAFHAELNSPRLKNTTFSIGSERHLDTILDRYAFYQFIETHGLGEVPRSIPGDADPWAVFPEGFLLRIKWSWQGLRKLDRVKLIRNRSEADQAIRECRKKGHDESAWCYQEVLSVLPRHNVSVCGWHDRENQTYLATRHVLRHPRRIGNGDVTQITEPPPGLLETTSGLLDALEYRGPFELEFVLDGNTESYKIIELNPRFWMQHGLVGAATGEELVRRYLGVAKPEAIADTSRTNVSTWVNTVYALFRILRGDLRVLRYLGHSSVKVPAWRTAMRWLPRYAGNLARRLLAQ